MVCFFAGFFFGGGGGLGGEGQFSLTVTLVQHHRSLQISTVVS